MSADMKSFVQQLFNNEPVSAEEAREETTAATTAISDETMQAYHATVAPKVEDNRTPGQKFAADLFANSSAGRFKINLF